MEFHKENLIPGPKKRVWIEEDPGHWEKYWVDHKGKLTKCMPHRLKWWSLPNMCMTAGWNNIEDPLYYAKTLQAMRAVLKITAQQLYGLFGYDVYRTIWLELQREEEITRQAWKDATMAIVAKAIDLIPYPDVDWLPDLKGWLRDFLMWFANSFYDLLFSIQL